MDLTLLETQPWRFRVRFEPGEACFRDHFPDNPVVPGSLVMALCLDCLRQYSKPDAPLTIERFSFARFAPPGRYDLCIDHVAATYRCSLRQGGEVFAQGRIKVCA